MASTNEMNINWLPKKIALLGYHAVGKTSLISQFVEQKFPESYLSTIGLKVDKKKVELGEHHVELIIWDIAGQENMAHIPQYYLNGCAGFIYVVDVSRTETYEDLKNKLHMIQSIVPKAQCVIAANKKDLLSDEELEKVMSACEIRPDIATSAKENDNVEDLFKMLALKLVEAMNLSELKLSLINPKTQIVVFSKDGSLLKSCQSMEDVSAFINSSIYDMDPLFKSMEQTIQELLPNSAHIDIPCVDFDFFGRKGYFDFQISVHPDFPDLRVWLTLDNTPVYRYYQKIQQQRNELLLEKQSRLKAG